MLGNEIPGVAFNALAGVIGLLVGIIVTFVWRGSPAGLSPASLRRALKGLPAPVLDSVAKAVNVRPPVLRAGSPKPLKRLHDALMLDAVASAVSEWAETREKFDGALFVDWRRMVFDGVAA